MTGPQGVVWRGTWSSSATSYALNDGVQYFCSNDCGITMVDQRSSDNISWLHVTLCAHRYDPDTELCNNYNSPAGCSATSAATTGNIAIIEGIVIPSAAGTITVRFCIRSSQLCNRSQGRQHFGMVVVTPASRRRSCQIVVSVRMNRSSDRIAGRHSGLMDETGLA